MCHGGRGREEVGETPQTAAIHAPHAVYESLLSGLEEHQCVLEKKNKNKSSYNNKRQNVTRQNWNVRIGMWRKVSIIPRPSLAPGLHTASDLRSNWSQERRLQEKLNLVPGMRKFSLRNSFGVNFKGRNESTLTSVPGHSQI